MKCLFPFIFLFAFNAKATGIPVVDTNQLIAELKDSAYLLDSVSELVEEIGIAGEEAQYLMALQRQMNGLTDDLRTLQSFNEDISDLGEYKSMRGQILADRIRNFTQYIRKLKRVVATASSMRARPQAMMVSLQLLEQSRQRDNDKMEAKMMAAEEMEKIDTTRKKVRQEVAQREQLNHEKKNIYSSSNTSREFMPLQVKASAPRNSQKRLM